MEKLNSTDINQALKDVRNAYRLLAIYQKRLLDIIKYVANTYNVTFDSGWSKFSNAAGHGNRAHIDRLSWDWLSLYLYDFNLGTRDFDPDSYHFKIVHQADTGFYDANVNQRIIKENVEEFSDVNTSTTRLFFVLSKNGNDGCPIHHILNGNLRAVDKNQIVKENWLSVPYNLERFSTQSTTDSVLNEFNTICKGNFGIDLFSLKS